MQDNIKQKHSDLKSFKFCFVMSRREKAENIILVILIPKIFMSIIV